MVQNDPFNITDYETHLKNNDYDTFNYIHGGDTNLVLMSQSKYDINDETLDDEIMLYLSNVFQIIEKVKIFENSIIRLCKSHKRSIENYTEVLKIPFVNDANRDYESNKCQYYSYFIKSTSELHGYLLKFKNTLQSYDLFYFYFTIMCFLQLLISISPAECLVKFKVTQNEHDFIKEIPKGILKEILKELPEGNTIDINILEDKILSSKLIIEYFIHQNLNSSNKVTAVQ